MWKTHQPEDSCLETSLFSLTPTICNMHYKKQKQYYFQVKLIKWFQNWVTYHMHSGWTQACSELSFDKPTEQLTRSQPAEDSSYPKLGYTNRHGPRIPAFLAIHKYNRRQQGYRTAIYPAKKAIRQHTIPRKFHYKGLPRFPISAMLRNLERSSNKGWT